MTTVKIERALFIYVHISICTDHRIIEIVGLRPSNMLPVSYYCKYLVVKTIFNELYQALNMKKIMKKNP
jgi:hypothetical protein